ncbi:MAG: CBS domain-containing protein [Bacilli bacterium]
MMTAADFMITDVISVFPDSSIRELLLLFAAHNVSGVPVLDPQRRLKGMVTISDVLRNLRPHTAHTLDMGVFMSFYVREKSLPDMMTELIARPVSEVMTTGRLSAVKPDTGLADIAEIFGEQRFKKLPVVNDAHVVVGVVSRGDLTRYIVRELLKD